MSSFNKLELNELIKFIEKSRRCICAILGKKTEFTIGEHGSSLTETSASCIAHFHLHLFPTTIHMPKRLLNSKNAIVSNYLGISKITFPYIMLQSGESKIYVAQDHGFPKQYIRRIIASHFGKDEEWNWNEYLEINKIESFLAKL